MELVKFIIPPDSSAYSVSDGNEVVSTKLDGGASRYRRDMIGATSTVNVSWILGRDEFKYLRSFYRGITGKGAEPFLIDLILDDYELTEHVVHFVEGSMQLTSQKGLTYWVSAQLEVTPNEDLDNGGFAYVYNEFGANWQYNLDQLQIIVNNKWPEVL
jgi:phage pi2 protein 07